MSNPLERIDGLVQADRYAPHYHFIAPEGTALPFDPNGALFWNARYHLFYIFQDPTLPDGGHCWGHASSTDLLFWTFHPAALVPAPGDPDKGIFSGGAFINKEGVPTIVYHGVGAGTCIATADDDELIHWTKSPHNPVISEPKEGDDTWGVYNVFDPHAWVEGDGYRMILGGRVKPYDIRDTAYLFESDDLIHWRYLRPFYNPNPHWTGEEEDCACPDFFPIGDRHMLLCISHPRGTRYYLGRYRGNTFIPEEHHRMNWPGGPCFAPETLLDDRGRRIFWAWVLDHRKGKWLVHRELGVMTLPRVFSLDDQGHLRIEPPEEFQRLRHDLRQTGPLALEPGQDFRLDGIAGDRVELEVDIEPAEGGSVGVKVLLSPDGAEQTVILFDSATATLSVDTTLSSLNEDLFQQDPIIFWTGDGKQQDVRVQRAPLALDSGESLKLRIFIDRSILEVFANDRQCLTQRVYPTRDDSRGVALFCGGGRSTVLSVSGWQMHRINGVTPF